MCGIVGILNLAEGAPPEESLLRRMLAMIRHRGPDEFGVYLGDRVGLGNARLSIIDLKGGQQPIGNEDGSCWIVFNGEIFNFPELRKGLEDRGHRFSTHTDTEVILHLYEEEGPDLLRRLNGQFAIAIWDQARERLFLARDRLGVRPLFYTRAGGRLVFGSEIKAILADRTISSELDPAVLEQVFTYWSALSPATCFRGIVEVPPGHYLLADREGVEVCPYWHLTFPRSMPGAVRGTHGGAGNNHAGVSLEEEAEALEALLLDATRIRLRADVPVGAYLSGGLDSSLVAALARGVVASRLETFSIAFDDPRFDESAHQERMARFLNTEHHVLRASFADIGRVFQDLVWHVEAPILRTAPAPMFLLSKMVRQHGFKVVLTGEGADEFLAGYDVFKEARIRRFWARQPDSAWRPALLRRLYPDIPRLRQTGDANLRAFFGVGLQDLDAWDYSHAIRWRNTRRTSRFLARGHRTSTEDRAIGLPLMPDLPKDFPSWGPLERAQYLEITIFLSQYLLCSQGDRPAMAHSVEGRFPFLDSRMVEFCCSLPPGLKLRGLTEKFLLKKVGRRHLPADIWARPKRPYRAPVQQSFLNEECRDRVRDLLSDVELKESGVFQPTAVQQLLARGLEGRHLGETEEMALTGIISTQLLHRQFVRGFTAMDPLSPRDRVKVVHERPPAVRTADWVRLEA